MQFDLFSLLVPFQSYDDRGITFQHSLVYYRMPFS